MERPASQNSKFKSKIPVFKGTTNKTTQAAKPKVTFKFKDISNTTDSRPRAADGSKAQSTSQRACARKLIKTDDVSDIPFEPDEKALSSILSNKGVESVVTNNSRALSERIVSAVTPAQLNRMTNIGCVRTVPKTLKTPINCYTYAHPSTTSSLMESYLEHQENLKIYREKMKHIRANLFVADPDAKKSILNGQGISTTSESTFRPSIYKDYSCTSSLMESYLEYEENMKIFRRNTQGLFNVCTTPFKPSHEVQLSKSPFRTPAAQNRNASQASSAMRVPSSILKTHTAHTGSALKFSAGNQVPVDQTKNVSWSSRKVGFSDVVSDYRPTSILKNTLSNRDDSEDSGQDDCIKKNNGWAHQQTLPSTAQNKHFMPSSVEFLNCPPKSSVGFQQAPLLVTSNTESPARTPFKSLVFNNKIGDIKLPMRIPVTPKNENAKPPCRAQNTPVKNELMKLPGRTPVTPKENGYNNLPKRTPVLKSGNRQLYRSDTDSAL